MSSVSKSHQRDITPAWEGYMRTKQRKYARQLNEYVHSMYHPVKGMIGRDMERARKAREAVLSKYSPQKSQVKEVCTAISIGAIAIVLLGVFIWFVELYVRIYL